MIYNKKYETMPREDLKQLQIERLQSTLNRVYRHVAFYKNKFDDNNINIEKVKGIDDIRELPLTTRSDLRESYPYDMFAVPLKDIVRIHSSSGTTGKPIVVGYTINDINRWSELVARLLVAAGVSENDFVQVALDYSLFTGGFGFHYGAEKIGASVIPSSADRNLQKQIIIMRDYKTSALVSTPSYAIEIGNVLKEMGMHPEKLNLQFGLFGAEPWSDELRTQIEEQLYLSAFDNYGLSEIMGPGVSGECEKKNGLHVNEDHFIVEVINPKTLAPCSMGEEGELVLTTLTKEGFPLVRYRTGDLALLMDGECDCGRTFVRMSRVAGRADNIIIIRGLKIFPSQIKEILQTIEGIEPHYQIVIYKEDENDKIDIKLEVYEKIFDDELKKLVELKNRISGIMFDKLGISAKITLVEQGSLVKTSSKVIDNR